MAMEVKHIVRLKAVEIGRPEKKREVKRDPKEKKRKKRKKKFILKVHFSFLFTVI